MKTLELVKIKLLRNTVASGKRVSEGQCAEVSKKDAAILIQMGKAVLFVDACEPELKVEEILIEEPKEQTFEPELKHGKKKKKGH